MSLADDYNDADYLQIGWHLTEISEHRMFKYNSGNDGVEYILKDDTGAQTKLSFALTGKGTKRLASFAKKCGVTIEQAANFEPTVDAHHKKFMHGKRVRVWVDKIGDFHEATDWSPADKPEPPPINDSRYKPFPEKKQEGVPAGEDIPF